MQDARPRMTNLFLQLGLDESPDAIAEFINSHQLSTDIDIADAVFWSEAQRQFISEQLKADMAWSLVIDELNESLHEDATKAQTGI